MHDDIVHCTNKTTQILQTSTNINRYYQHKIEYNIVKQPEDLPEVDYETAYLRNSLFSGRRFFRVMKQSIDSDDLYQIVFYQNGEPIASVCVTELLMKVGRTNVRVAICGNPLISCDCAIFTSTTVNRHLVLPIIRNLLTDALNKRRVQIVLLKEMCESDHAIGHTNYFSLPLDPILVLDIHKWDNFDEYICSMRSHYRGLIKKSFRNFEEKDIIVREEQHTHDVNDELYKLYNDVVHNPRPIRFHKAIFNANTFASFLTDLPRKFPSNMLKKEFFTVLKEEFPKEVDITTLIKSGEIVGATINIQDSDMFHSVYIGLRRDIANRAVLYRGLLATKIKHAFDRELPTIHFGRTSTDTKSDFGAIEMPENCYMKIKCSRLNKVMGLALKRIKAKQSFNARNVFNR